MSGTIGGGRVKRFNQLDRQGLIDRTSGAWDRSTNKRRAHCGRCGGVIAPGRGKPYNEFMTDGYRATTRYLCPPCQGGMKTP